MKSATVYLSPRYHALKFDPWPGGPSETLTWNVPRKYLTILRGSQHQGSVESSGSHSGGKDTGSGRGAGVAQAQIEASGSGPAQDAVASAVASPTAAMASDDEDAPAKRTLPEKEAREAVPGRGQATSAQGLVSVAQARQIARGGGDESGVKGATVVTTATKAPVYQMARESEAGERASAPAATVPAMTRPEQDAAPTGKEGDGDENEDGDVEVSSSARTREVSSSEESGVQHSRARRKSGKVKGSASGDVADGGASEDKTPAGVQEEKANREAGDRCEGVVGGEPRDQAEASAGEGPQASAATPSRPVYPVGTVVMVRDMDTDPGRSLKFARGETVEVTFRELLGREVSRVAWVSPSRGLRVWWGFGEGRGREPDLWTLQIPEQRRLRRRRRLFEEI